MSRVVSDPEILGGKPVVEGTRLSVEHILGLLSHGMTQKEVAEAHPELNVEDINAVLRYAAEALQNDVVIDVYRGGRLRSLDEPM
ncbi:MAG: DUF433 domain-containing protein [bacterium]|nr:DUF433 domain-containing protein [bacterium]